MIIKWRYKIIDLVGSHSTVTMSVCQVSNFNLHVYHREKYRNWLGLFIRYTVNPVLRGHLWDKEKVTL